jgi:hypothetical protein
MSKIRSRTPVSSFGPELLAALREGSERQVTFSFPDPKVAIRFIARINSLRVAMRREEHDYAEAVYRCGARIDPDNRCRVILAPRDSEFLSALKAAEVDVTPLLPKAPTPLPGVAPDDEAESFLSTLGMKSEKNVDGSD